MADDEENKAAPEELESANGGGEDSAAETNAPKEPAGEESADERTGKEDEIPAEENAEGSAKGEAPSQGFVRRYWLLGLGLLLALLGVAGTIALRLNYAQVYVFGELDPFTGIGSQEAMGHVASMVPFALGVVMVVYWGVKTEPLPDIPETTDDGGAGAPGPDAEAGEVEDKPEAEPGEFGHEHLPPHHLSTVEKIEHLTKVYAQGKMSKGLYEENLARFEAELDEQRRAKAAEPAKKPEPAKEPPTAAPKDARKSAYQELKSLKPEVAQNEEDHLPPHHLSPEEKIDHLTKSYGQGKVSRAFFEKNVKKFEAELKREREYLPPPEMHPRQKLEHLEDAYGMGVVSKSTYERNKKLFEEEAAKSKEAAPEVNVDFKSEVAGEQNLDDDLDSLLKEVKEDGGKKPEGRKKSLLEELEDLEDL